MGVKRKSYSVGFKAKLVLKVIEQMELYVEQHDDFESYCQTLVAKVN